MKPLSFLRIDTELYALNRIVSLSLGFEKDIKRQKSYSEINELLAKAILIARKQDKVDE